MDQQYDFSEVSAFLTRTEDPSEMTMNTRDLFDDARIQDLEKGALGIPPEFLEYLRRIGAGAFREGQFTVYGWLSPVSEIVGPDIFPQEADSILCFGDNFSGDFAGFNPSNGWLVTELWHDTRELYETGKSFVHYIRDQMLMGPDGTDMRE